MELTPAQRLMVDEGLPSAAIISPEERKEAWKGRKLSRPKDLAAPKKDEDQATAKLRKELVAQEAAKKAARLERLQELNHHTRKAKIMKTVTMSKTDQVAALRVRRASAKGPKAASSAKAKPAKHSDPEQVPVYRPRRAKGAKAKPETGIRPGSKLELIVGLLTRKEGCTTADVLSVTDWPAVSMPQQAKAAGLKLKKVKEGKVTRYWAA
jgi:hypothetical protein